MRSGNTVSFTRHEIIKLGENLTEEQREEMREDDRVRHSTGRDREISEESKFRNELKRVKTSKVC